MGDIGLGANERDDRKMRAVWLSLLGWIDTGFSRDTWFVVRWTLKQPIPLQTA